MFNEIIIHGFQINGHRATLRERAKIRKTCGPYRWSPSQPGKGRGFYQASRGLRMGDSTIDLRLLWANDVLTGSRLASTTGYYTSPDCDGDTLQPIIARLNHGRGFLAGWTMGCSMAAYLDSHIYADAEDAARAAHSRADRDAEKERDYEASLCKECYENPCTCKTEDEGEE